MDISKLKKRGIQHLLSYVCVVASALFPVVFLWGENVKEISGFSTVAQSLLLFFLFGCASYFLGVLGTGSAFGGAVAGCYLTLCASNFQLLQKLLIHIMPSWRYWHTASVISLGFVLLCIACRKKRAAEWLPIAGTVLTCVFVGLVGLNFSTVILGGGLKLEEKPIMQQAVSESGGRNVYFLLFDEYAGSDFMAKYYNYDNTPHLKRMEKLGMNVSYSSRSECHDTRAITANMFNLDYVITADMWSRYSDYIPFIDKMHKDNSLFKILQEHEYQVRGVGEVSDYGLESSINVANFKQEDKTIDGKSFKEIVFANTMLYIIPDSKIEENVDAMQIMQCIEYVKDVNNFSGGSNFILMHLFLPHSPFLFDADGNEVMAINRVDWKNKKYYLNQYIYASKKMEELVESIIKYDPEAYIILLSDHAARGSGDKREIGGAPVEYEDMKDVFLSAYFAGEKVDVEGLTGMNLLRLTLNKLFTMDIPFIEPQSYPPIK